MDRDKYKKALIDVINKINECSSDCCDDDGSCICCKYPCWMFTAKEAIEKQIEKQLE